MCLRLFYVGVLRHPHAPQAILPQLHAQGRLPLSLFRRSGGVGFMSLKLLNLSSNLLTNYLPAPWGAGTSLTALDLSSNQISGTIPMGERARTAVGLKLEGKGWVGRLARCETCRCASRIGIEQLSSPVFPAVHPTRLNPLLGKTERAHVSDRSQPNYVFLCGGQRALTEGSTPCSST